MIFYKIFVFIKKVCFIGLTILSSFTSINSACKARPEIINVNSNNPVFYPFSIKKVAIVIILMTHMQKFVLLIL